MWRQGQNRFCRRLLLYSIVVGIPCKPLYAFQSARIHPSCNCSMKRRTTSSVARTYSTRSTRAHSTKSSAAANSSNHDGVTELKPNVSTSTITPQRKSKRARKSTKEALPNVVTPSPDTELASEDATLGCVDSLISLSPKKACQRKAPKNWQDLYSLVEELRSDRTAPCDLFGAEALAGPGDPSSPVYRFRTLVALMLSSQTKDATVAEAMRNMEAANLLTPEAIAEASAEALDSCISKVGFHNNKTKFLQQTARVLIEQYNGDIPPTALEMTKLPGVGPKMAFICESIAWGRSTGIGVDTHMHRLFNKLQWVQSSTPEQTRVQLEAWLPFEKWPTVNLLWVGFGQEVQQQPGKLLRKAIHHSTRPRDAVLFLKKCGMNCLKEAEKVNLDSELRCVMNGDAGNCSQAQVENAF